MRQTQIKQRRAAEATTWHHVTPLTPNLPDLAELAEQANLPPLPGLPLVPPAFGEQFDSARTAIVHFLNSASEERL